MGRYAELHWEHMGREETVILPAAQQHPQADDWAALNGAFADPAPCLGRMTGLDYHSPAGAHRLSPWTRGGAGGTRRPEAVDAADHGRVLRWVRTPPHRAAGSPMDAAARFFLPKCFKLQRFDCQ